MTRTKKNGILGMTFFLIVAASGMTQEREMTFVYPGPESENDTRYEYHVSVLREALERTREQFGEYSLIPSMPKTEDRQNVEMKTKSPNLNVIFRDPSFLIAGDLIPVPIPIEKGLLGYRVFLIRAEDQSRLDEVRTLDELREFTIGQHRDWSDVSILEDAGFTVIKGTTYEGLFRMLMNDRFDLFSRGVTEVLDEYAHRKDEFPDMHIEETICLYFPLPVFYWFQDSEDGRNRAARVEQGLWEMIDDGTMDRMFREYHESLIEELDLPDRNIFRIANPTLMGRIPYDDQRLWYDPLIQDRL